MGPVLSNTANRFFSRPPLQEHGKSKDRQKQISAVIDKILKEIPLEAIDPSDCDQITPACDLKRYENGLPINNNRVKLHLLQQKFAPPSSERLAPLDAMLERPRFRNGNSTTREHRTETLRQLRELVSHRLIDIDSVAYNFDNKDLIELTEKLSILNPSVATLMWVHFALGGVSIAKIGTQKHWDAFLDDSNSLKKILCLAMTEIGHGSNVQGLETTATYDPAAREFILHSPKTTSIKFWMGGAAENATHGILFARLISKEKDHGVHAFIFPLRENGVVSEGIEVHDIGRKRGLNGVDNGSIKFNQFRIPYDNLLDRYCEISPEGDYIPKEGNKNSQSLIYILMCQFVRGRQVIAIVSAYCLKLLCTLLYCYPPHLHQKNLNRTLVADKLSKAYAAEFAKEIILGANVDDHIPASLMKAILSEMSMEECVETREWYRNIHTAQIAEIIEDARCDADATLTYEGDNELLKSLGAFGVLKDIGKGMKQWLNDLKHLKLSAYRSIFDYFFQNKDPLSMLKWSVFDHAREIGNALLKCKNQSEQFELWSSTYQIDANHMAKMYAQTLIIQKFMEKAIEMDKKENTNVWSSLCNIYSWNTCHSLLKNFKMPDLNSDYATVKKEAPILVAKFGIKLSWLDAMLPPPDQSIPFDLMGRDFSSRKSAL